MNDENQPKRLRRVATWLAVLPALALSPLLGSLLLDSDDSEALPPPRGGEAAVSDPRQDDPEALALARRAGDPREELLDRVTALKGLATRSGDARAVLSVIEGIEATDPQAAQMRAMCLTALGRYPNDPRSQARLLLALEPDAPRAERILAVSVLERFPAARERLRGLLKDGDPAVREKVAALFAKNETR